jgi:hypothetical protein
MHQHNVVSGLLNFKIMRKAKKNCLASTDVFKLSNLSRNFPHFMTPGGPLPYSSQPATCLWSESDHVHNLNNLSWKPTLILTQQQRCQGLCRMHYVGERKGNVLLSFRYSFRLTKMAEKKINTKLKNFTAKRFKCKQCPNSNPWDIISAYHKLLCKLRNAELMLHMRKHTWALKIADIKSTH